jgi:hypothetical protein
MVMMSFCPGNRYSARNFGLGSFTEEVSRRSSKLFIFPSSVTKKSITDLSSSFFKKNSFREEKWFPQKRAPPKVEVFTLPVVSCSLGKIQ